ncbi:MAG: HPr family phosphocarrier protein, partial [Planctomycetaceae bacterium]
EDAASVLSLMLLAATQGTPLTVSATGPEADDAVRAVVADQEYQADQTKPQHPHDHGAGDRAPRGRPVPAGIAVHGSRRPWASVLLVRDRPASHDSTTQAIRHGRRTKLPFAGHPLGIMVCWKRSTFLKVTILDRRQSIMLEMCPGYSLGSRAVSFFSRMRTNSCGFLLRRRDTIPRS